MRGCRHKRRVAEPCRHGRWHEVKIGKATHRHCMDCGDPMPLGPSSDESEAVRVEMRAAALADVPEAVFTTCEWMGWNGDETYFAAGSYHTLDELPTRNLREYNAGWLAREIAIHTHDGEQDGGGE